MAQPSTRKGIGRKAYLRLQAETHARLAREIAGGGASYPVEDKQGAPSVLANKGDGVRGRSTPPANATSPATVPLSEKSERHRDSSDLFRRTGDRE